MTSGTREKRNKNRTCDNMNAIATAAILGFGILTGGVSAAPGEEKTVEILSQPISIRYGEVNNKFQPNQDLPQEIVDGFKNKTMAIVDYQVDIVDAQGDPVPLFDMYNHHYAALFGTKEYANAIYQLFKDAPFGIPSPSNLTELVIPENLRMNATGGDGSSSSFRASNNNRKLLMMEMMQNIEKFQSIADNNRGGFGGGAGAEMRKVNNRAPEGYAYFVDNPEQWTPLFHFINQKVPEGVDASDSALLECPCTPQRVIDVKNGTIDGTKNFANPFGTCNEAFEESNPSCELSTYVGGWRCCEDGIFVLDTDKYDVDTLPKDEVFGKFTMTYLDGVDAKETDLKPLDSLGGDITGSVYTHGNVEFDVPQCADGTAPENCVYEMETVHYISGGINATDDTVYEIPYMVAHLHKSGIDMTMYNMTTGDVICRSTPIYGNGTEAGNEDGYLVGMNPCYFEGDDLIVAPANEKVKSVVRYNATEPHTGVMALWFPKGTKVSA